MRPMVDELISLAMPHRFPSSRGKTSVGSALAGLLTIGVPAGLYAFFGRSRDVADGSATGLAEE